ncbi:Scr1 family TA system antitoxin-like transcriptional regulator [Streptomyces sp. NPDC003697]
MNGRTTHQESQDSRHLPAVRHLPIARLYRWDVHRISDGRHQEGPSGTCTTEDSAGVRDGRRARPPCPAGGPDLLYGETFIRGQTTVEPDQVQRHKPAFNLIQSTALSPDHSRALLRRLKEKQANGPA